MRRVFKPGRISFQGRQIFVGHGLIGEPVAVRPTGTEGVWTVTYCHHQVPTIGLNQIQEV